jgi:hypothetical protein
VLQPLRETDESDRSTIFSANLVKFCFFPTVIFLLYWNQIQISQFNFSLYSSDLNPLSYYFSPFSFIPSNFLSFSTNQTSWMAQATISKGLKLLLHLLLHDLISSSDFYVKCLGSILNGIPRPVSRPILQVISVSLQIPNFLQ